MQERLRNIIKSESFRRIMIPAGIVLTTLFIGTTGYAILWRNYDTSLIDALYMAFITITTLGYAEIYPLGTAGRIFTMIIATVGIGSLFYTFGVVMEELVFSQLGNKRKKKKMEKTIAEMRGHIILVGLGRVGRLAALELMRGSLDFVTIETSDEYLDFAEKNNILFIKGDASEDATLLKAGIERARGIIVATGLDSTNVFIVLTARVLNPNIFIVARAENEVNIAKLLRAGADRAIDPYAIGGQHLANLMIHPGAVDFVQTAISRRNENFSIEYIPVHEGSRVAGMSIGEITKSLFSGGLVLAVLRDKESIVNPDPGYRILERDELVVFGSRDQLVHLEAATGSGE